MSELLPRVSAWPRYVAAAVVLLSTACLPRGDPCDSDLDCPGGSRCTNELCSGAQKPSIVPGNCGDAYEPNDRAGDAHLLTPGTLRGLRVCAGDDDWFAVMLGVDDRLSVTLTPGNANDGAGVRLGVFGADGTLLALTSGRGEGGQARVGDVRAKAAGRHFIRVYESGASGTIDYSLTVERETRRCAAAEALDASRAAGAPNLVAGASAGALPESGELFLRVAMAPGESVAVTLTFATEGGSFDALLYTEDQELLRELRPSIARAPGRVEVRFGPVSGDELGFLRLLGPAGGAYRLITQRTPSQTRREGVARGVARYEDRPATRAGLGDPIPRGIPNAAIEVYRPADDYVVGRGGTDLEGRFEVAYVNRGDPALAVRVLARRVDGFVRAQVLRGESCREVYGVTTPLPTTDVTPPPAADAEVSLLARATDAGGAFNLHSEVARAFNRLASLGYSPAAAPLDIFWERGTKLPCGSCESLGALFIGGGAADPDEYDDAVVLHELGHFFEETYSRTSTPGGHHDGSRATPPLAWSEGFATYFSAALRDSPLYLDTRDGDTFILDLEAPSRRASIGTENDRLDGDLSEDLVSAALWDLHDGASASEPDDVVALGFAGTLRPTTAYFNSPDKADRGATGIDFVDYLDGLLCLRVSERALVEPILAARRFPYDFAGPRACAPARRKPSAPLTLELHVSPDGTGDGFELVARARIFSDADAVLLRFQLPVGWRIRSGATEQVAADVLAGEALEVRAQVVSDDAAPASTTPPRFLAHAAAFGPGQTVRPVVRDWPTAPRRLPPLGHPAVSADGHPLMIFGGSP